MLPKILLILLSLFPSPVFAESVDPNIAIAQNQTQFQSNLIKITDPQKKALVIKANQLLKDLNQSECLKLDNDLNKMAAILQEEKIRQNDYKTTAAFGGLNTPLDSAEYYLTYAAEAVAYQQAQDYTPDISGSLQSGFNQSIDDLESNLNTTQTKVLTAKTYLQKALDYYEK